jgi:2-polyprenyl-3-methyl-5-hydroxy-6-metoxy-1,4-benzoquinol methylase
MIPHPMAIAVLYPRFDHPAIEERYAGWQSQMRLGRGAEHARIEFYDPHEPAAEVIADVHEPHVLVVTDPLVVPSERIGVRLREALETTGAAAAVPVTNEARHPEQRVAPAAPYVTLRELEEVFTLMEGAPAPPRRTTWDESNPSAYLCRRETLAAERAQLRRALRGREVAIDPGTYAHVWSPMRIQVREDILPFVPQTARSVLELGCAEGGLGALVKARQKCRVVGIELDHDAAAMARRKLDDVYTGDVRHILEVLAEQFECVIASEIVEHVDDPWSMLSEIRRVTAPGGRLVISIPNVANASLIGDLVRGRFDYTYMGLACAGHLRFFTRASIEELLGIAGWRIGSIVPQHFIVSEPARQLIAALRAAGMPADENELLATGYYVVAVNE